MTKKIEELFSDIADSFSKLKIVKIFKKQ